MNVETKACEYLKKSSFHGASQVVLVVKNLPANAEDTRNAGSIPGLERSPGGDWLSTPVLLPGRSGVQRNLEGYSPWGRKDVDTTE